MSATYTNQPGTRPIDTVRFEIDDTDCIPETDAMLSDEEIQYLIDSAGSILFAAAAAASQIAGKYATEAKRKKVGDLEVEQGGDGTASQYRTLARDLRARAARGAAPYAGGLTHSETATVAADADRNRIELVPGRDDHEGTSSNSVQGVTDW